MRNLRILKTSLVYEHIFKQILRRSGFLWIWEIWNPTGIAVESREMVAKLTCVSTKALAITIIHSLAVLATTFTCRHISLMRISRIYPYVPLWVSRSISMHLNAGVLWTVLYYELTLLYLPYKESSTRHLNVIYHIRIKWKVDKPTQWPPSSARLNHIRISLYQNKDETTIKTAAHSVNNHDVNNGAN